MAMYAIGLTPLLNIMLEVVVGTVMAAFADDITSVGKCETLRTCWENLVDIGPSFGYLPQPKKSWLIVKQQHLNKAMEIFQDHRHTIFNKRRATLGSSDWG